MTDTEPAGADEPQITPVQYALLDDVREIAMCADAPGAEFAARHLVRLLCLELGHPLPEPVQREGGFMGMLYGNPVKHAPGAP